MGEGVGGEAGIRNESSPGLGGALNFIQVCFSKRRNFQETWSHTLELGRLNG